MMSATHPDCQGAPFGGSALDRLLQDPLIRLVMASDGVVDADIRQVARRIAARLPSAPPVRPARRNGCAGLA